MRAIYSFLVAVAALSAGASVRAAEPVELKNRRELFVDDFLVRETSGLERRLGVPQFAGMALRLDQPWEGRWGAYISVVSDGQKFQMYYRGGFGAAKNGDLTCYAESVDGRLWTRPNVGRFTVGGRTDNNIVMPIGEPTWATHNFTVWYDARPGVPDEER